MPPPRPGPRGLISLAVLYYLTGDYTAGGELLGPAREAALAGADPVAASKALSFSAYLRIFDGDLEAAERVAHEALAEIAVLGESAVQAEQQMLLGQVLRFGGRTGEALVELEKSARTAAACGHGWVQGSAGWISCKVLTESGRDAEAAARLRELMAFWTAEGDVTSRLVAAMSLAGCLARLGRPEPAAVLLGAVAAQGERVGFLPLDMVQFGGPDDAESVRTRLSPAAYDQALARGRADAERVLADADALAPDDAPAPAHAPADPDPDPLEARAPARAGS